MSKSSTREYLPAFVAKNLSAEQVKGIQHSMRLSDAQLCEVLGFATGAGMTRIQRWKDPHREEEPSGPAAKLLVLLHRLDSAMRIADTGDNARAMEMVRDALPDYLQ